MKRIRIGAALTLFWTLTVPAIVSAAPIGRPVAAEHQWRLGAVLSIENTEVAQEAINLKGEEQSLLYLGEAAYGLSQDAEFYLRFGGSREKFSAGSFNAVLGSQLDWGLGLRGVMYNSWTNWKLIGDIQYLARPGRGFGAADIDINEWQIAGAVETRIGDFLPYGGLFYDDIRIKSNNQSVFRTVQSDKNLGIYFGTGVEPNEDWSLYIETRLLTGNAFSAGAYYRF